MLSSVFAPNVPVELTGWESVLVVVVIVLVGVVLWGLGRIGA